MIANAQARFIRITPRKFRQIIPLVKGRPPEEAIAILTNVNKRASQYAIELLKSAIANAKRLRQDIDVSNLYISRMIADGGPMLKRFRAASMGRAAMIKKRTSHILIELDETPQKTGATKKAGSAKTEVKPAKAQGETDAKKPKRAHTK